MSDYVIIGNSTAGIACVEGIRKVDRKGTITVIASEPHHTYSRPLISYLLLGATDGERMKYRGDGFYFDNGVKTQLGTTVTKINPTAKKLLLSNGKSVSYKKLLVATGSRPFVPPTEGLELVKNRFSFMTLDDAHALEAALTPTSRVLVVGGGLIGLKCVEGIADRVAEVTVVDLADRILPSILDAAGSRRVQTYLEKEKGIAFRLGDCVQRFTADTATLKSGETLPFDLLVMAVGVRPNTELVKEAGGKVGRGITVDEFSRTSLPDVYAAGDCTECNDISANTTRVLALLPNAYQQGEAAGRHMAGDDSHPFTQAVPMNAIGFFGLHMVTAGSYIGDPVVLEDEETYKCFFVEDNLLKGYIVIGRVDRAGIYTSLIRDQVPLDTVNFELIKKEPQMMALCAEYRAKKLGGKGL